MNIKKYVIYGGLAATLLVGVASLALAEDDNFNKAMMGKHEGPDMKVEIGPQGRTLLRGTIKTVSTGSLTVTSWGGDWMVNISSSANVMPSDMTQFKVGDFVGVQGMINKTSVWTVDAMLVRDWTLKQAEQTNKQEIKDLMQSVSPRNWQGTASNVNASSNSLTLTIDGTAYSVALATNAKIVNEKFATVAFSAIQNGDTARVWATLSGTTLTAYVVRDISLH